MDRVVILKADEVTCWNPEGISHISDATLHSAETMLEAGEITSRDADILISAPHSGKLPSTIHIKRPTRRQKEKLKLNKMWNAIVCMHNVVRS